MSELHNIFDHSNCLSQDVLLNYRNGNLTAEQRHKVERHLLDCEMCSDALEGMSQMPDEQVSKNIADLNTAIDNRLLKKDGKRFFLYEYRTQLAVAASVIFILGLVWFFRNNTTLDQISPETSEKIFAEQFEPYQPEETDNAVAVTESEMPSSDRTMLREKEMSVKTDAGALDQSKVVDLEAEKNDVVVQSNQEIDDVVEAEQPSTNMAAAQPREPVMPQGMAGATSGKAVMADRDVETKPAKSVAITKAEEPVADRKDKSKRSYKKMAESQTKSAPQAQAVPAMEEMAADEIQQSTTGNAPAAKPRDGVKLYREGNYAASEKVFEDELQKNADDRRSRFYYSMNLLSQNKTKEAIESFEKLVKKEGEYYRDALWYLSLSHVKLQEKRKARKYLERIIALPEGQYSDKAKQTLKELGQ